VTELQRPDNGVIDEIVAIEESHKSGAWTSSTTRAFLELATTRAWVATHDDQVVGHVIASVAGDVGEIVTVAVHHEALRQGNAVKLMRAALWDWQQLGVNEAFLEVAEHNVAARSLYLHLGWRDVGRRKRYYKDGSDAIIMRLSVADTTVDSPR
jgi:ribosomal-protein-alanine N-acetyltransferase